MLVTFLIMLREGVEAALIVSIVVSFLKQSGHPKMIVNVWIGVVLAVLLCAVLGWVIYRTTDVIPHRQQGMVSAFAGLFAVAMLTYMVLWMSKAARTMKQQLQDSVAAAVEHRNGFGWALVGMAFLAVVREGIETVFFLLAIFQQGYSANMPLGAVLGLAVAIVLGWLMYEGGVRINLGKFFRWTGIFLIFIAAGLFAGAFRGLNNAGLWDIGQQVVFDWSGVLSENSAFGALMSGIFGYKDHPTVSDISFYLLYLIPVLFLFLRSSRVPHSQKS